ncbi:MAG: hypothetical protein K0R54_5731 [Clostridiaceae bacterium]|jgi:hypothetical protein|nr:hypothetical protein [Clostridiaceae bacterium]
MLENGLGDLPFYTSPFGIEDDKGEEPFTTEI